MTHRRADDTTGRGTAQCADAGAFLARTQRTASATRQQERSTQNRNTRTLHNRFASKHIVLPFISSNLNLRTYLFYLWPFRSLASRPLSDGLCPAACDVRRRAPNPCPDPRTTANWY